MDGKNNSPGLRPPDDVSRKTLRREALGGKLPSLSHPAEGIQSAVTNESTASTTPISSRISPSRRTQQRPDDAMALPPLLSAEGLAWLIAYAIAVGFTLSLAYATAGLIFACWAMYTHFWRVLTTKNTLRRDWTASGSFTIILTATTVACAASVVWFAVNIAFGRLFSKSASLLAVLAHLAAYVAPVTYLTVFRYSDLITYRPPEPQHAVGSKAYKANRRAWLHDMRGGKSIARKHIGPVPLKLTLIIAGSGGHTREMINMLSETPDLGLNHYRRWVVTEGDTNSINEIRRYEDWVLEEGRKAGHQIPAQGNVMAFEIKKIRRARKVHQPWKTVPLTALFCIIDVFKVLNLACPRPLSVEGYPFPHVILTNGPGTGFIVALTSFFMRMLWLIPEDLCRVVFVESIARVKTLSVTGKLFYLTGIADRFIVQHPQVAKEYPGVHCEEMLAARQTVKQA